MLILHNYDLGWLLATSSDDSPQWELNFVVAVRRGLWATDDYDTSVAMADNVAKLTKTMVSVIDILRLPCYHTTN